MFNFFWKAENKEKLGSEKKTVTLAVTVTFNLEILKQKENRKTQQAHVIAICMRIVPLTLTLTL